MNTLLEKLALLTQSECRHALTWAGGRWQDAGPITEEEAWRISDDVMLYAPKEVSSALAALEARGPCTVYIIKEGEDVTISVYPLVGATP